MKSFIVSTVAVVSVAVLWTVVLGKSYVVENTFISGMAMSAMVMVYGVAGVVRWFYHNRRQGDYNRMERNNDDEPLRVDHMRWLLLSALCSVVRVSVPILIWFYPDFIYNDEERNDWVPLFFVLLGVAGILRMMYYIVVTEEWRMLRIFHCVTLLAVISIIGTLCIADRVWIASESTRLVMVIIMAFDVVPGIVRALFLYI